MMKELYTERKQQQQKKLGKYLKYIFNDHLMIVVMLIIGGGSFAYADFVKSLQPSSWLPVAFCGLVLFAGLAVGRVATLVRSADRIFLLPQEEAMDHYLYQSIRHSIWLPIFTNLFLLALVSPILAKVQGFRGVDFLLVAATLLISKFAELGIQMSAFFQQEQRIRQQRRFVWYLLSAVVLGMALFWETWIAALIAIALAAYAWRMVLRKLQQDSLDWEYMIQVEQNRLLAIYRVIHLFTDVPGIVGTVKRRKYLDVFLTGIRQRPENVYVYLYARTFLRGTTYLGYYLRLIGVALLLCWFTPQTWIYTGIALVFLFLTGLQLVPLYEEHDYVFMPKLYPTPSRYKKQAMKKIMTVLLESATFIFVVLAFFRLPNVGAAVQASVVLVGGSLALSQLYFPARLKKMNAGS